MASAPVISAAAMMPRDLQVRITRGRRANAHVVIGESDVQRFAIGIRVDGHGRDLELAAGADDAQRDLAAVRDQDFLEHAAGAVGRSSRRVDRPNGEPPTAPRASSPRSPAIDSQSNAVVAVSGRCRNMQRRRAAFNSRRRCLLESVPARVARRRYTLDAKRELARVAGVE